MSRTLPRALYTWVDVQFALEESRAAGAWPDWLVSASVYFDSVLLRVLEGTEGSEIKKFLGNVFGERFQPEQQTILFESAPDQVRGLGVEIEESKEAKSHERRNGIEPFFRRLATLPASPAGVILPAALPSGSPAIVAFYSFKGGVGRTTHLLALLQCLTSRPNPPRALIIDADLEAPGICRLLLTQSEDRRST